MYENEPNYDPYGVPNLKTRRFDIYTQEKHLNKTVFDSFKRFFSKKNSWTEDTDHIEVNPIINPTVFFDISIGGEKAGRIEFNLKFNVVPLTAENFRVLCTGEKGFGYKGCAIHSVIPDRWCVGGDFTSKDGKGGKSIYGGQYFDDENYKLKHTGPGQLSMCSFGEDQNGSQFFLSMTQMEWANSERKVVFGDISNGKTGYNVLKAIESVGSMWGKTKEPVIIEDCGELRLIKPLLGR